MTSSPMLKRELGVFGAVMMGLGSIVGTGVFVSIGVAAGVIGPAVVLAVMVGAMVATFNGLNSAQLAANHPVSGGTYEYGYRYLNPRLGFVAGWVFLLAKSASAATAALGFAGYALDALGMSTGFIVPVAVGIVIVLTVVVLSGIRRSNRVNVTIVSITLASLAIFVVTGIPSIDTSNFSGFLVTPEGGFVPNFLQAAALMFVAYTGYGRIATLGEEVREPRRTIPRAVITALVTIMIIYAAVTIVAVGTLSAPGLGEATAQQAAPLEVAAQTFGIGVVPLLVTIGAVTAMVGVLLNLVLGLSRVLLAMGRRRDMPPVVATLNQEGTTPTVAVIVMGTFIALLALIGDVRTTWTFSAFTVLIYYAITNAAALQIPDEGRMFPRWVAWLGLIACLSLAFFVPVTVWLIGLALIAVGVVWQMVMGRVYASGK